MNRVELPNVCVLGPSPYELCIGQKGKWTKLPFTPQLLISCTEAKFSL